MGRTGRREYRAALENSCADRIVAMLIAEGHEVANLRRPDRLQRQARAPDFDFELDGERVALEVTEFTISTAEMQAAVVALKVAERVRHALRPLAAELALGLVVVQFHYFAGRMPTKRRFEAEYATFERAIAEAMRELAATGETEVIVEPSAAWLRLAPRVTARTTAGAPTVAVIHTGGAHYAGGVVQAFIDRTAAKKASQIEGYGRAILTVLRGWADREDLTEGFRAAGEVPWWRVYLLEREGDPVLVYPVE
jgi:hypothetical protein